MPARKTRTAFFCTRCGAEHSRWQGQCRECGEWNTLAEERIVTPSRKSHAAASGRAVPLTDISTAASTGITTGIVELDRVLGGSFLPGQTVLLGGEPGIGKSTLLLQAAFALAEQGLPVLYVSGEESPAQIRLRAQRLGALASGILVLNATSVEEALNAAEASQCRVIIVDSIQTLSTEQIDSPPGTVSQLREVAHRLIMFAKQAGVGLFLVGHITKDGLVAGPKLLEHMVDTVLYFEGDSSHLYRLVRPSKNRFGSVAEIGLFEMSPAGLREVSNPSSLFLSERGAAARTGSMVAAMCEGNRPLLVELQALVSEAHFGTPQRVAGGLDNKRLALLLAIIEKRGGFPMSRQDVFVSVAGGLRLSEPALDLPLLIAIGSSHTNRPIEPLTAACGEVGLSGEVRGITLVERRVQEAARLGFKRLIAPAASIKSITSATLELVPVGDISAALEIALV